MKVGKFLWSAAKPGLLRVVGFRRVEADALPPGIAEARGAWHKIMERVRQSAAQAHVPDALPWAALHTLHAELDARVKHRNHLAYAAEAAFRELNAMCPEPVIAPEAPPQLRVVGSLRDALSAKGGNHG
jgi:hypothetical protein